jgi:heparin binding hemagglutinin HbhA
MAVSLPTAADVRKIREQAAKNAAERAEVARTPLFAVLGAGDAAVTAVSKAVADARALPQKLTVAELREQAEAAYADFAERGEKAWGKLRTRPQVKQAIARLESYSEVLDARVDGFVDDAHDAAEKALAVVTRQTRSTGETLARNTEKAADEAAEKLTEVSGDAAERLTEAGDDAAHETRSATRRIANRTAPKVAPKLTQPKPATRRTINGTSGS